jgi:hypothetical protein
MKKFAAIVFVCTLHLVATCQKKPKINDSTILSIDTLRTKGDDYTLIHYHMVSRMLQKKIILDSTDSIFDNRYNDFSRLIMSGHKYSFNVATIPLTHVIFLENLKLILGLSKFTNSPYNVVLYSTEGKLLYKYKIPAFELKVNKSELKQLLKTHPGLDSCLSKMKVIKENENYYLEISTCFANIIGRESLLEMKTLRLSHYFPNISAPATEDFYYTQFYNYFSGSDPLYDLIMIGSVPYLLILNSENGTRVNIPLMSNCNIFKEIQN